tara:strand:- start:1357 stop:2046 length:690 start_codon:yes stop_codon:yes gene_type:complete
MSNYVPKRLAIAEFLIQILSRPFFNILKRTKLSPNQITLIGAIIAIIGVILYPINLFIASFLLLLYMILDLVDGDIAREKKMFSVLGSWGDSMTDKLIEGLILFAAYVRLGNEPFYQSLIFIILIYMFVSQFSMQLINTLIKSKDLKIKKVKKNSLKKKNNLKENTQNFIKYLLNSFTLAHCSLILILTFGALLVNLKLIVFILFIMSLFSTIVLTVSHSKICLKYENG